MNKNVLIPFSGGLDSTYLLYKNLKKYNIVTTLYIQLLNNSYKTTIELAHRKYILEYLNKEFSEDLFSRDLCSSQINIIGSVQKRQ